MIKNIRHEHKNLTNYANIQYKLNAKAETLTMQQHTALAIIASYRHDLHSTSGYYLTLPEEKKNKLENFFEKLMPIMLRTVGLPQISIEKEDFEELATLDESMRTEAEERIDEVNAKIESYLSMVDRVCDTSYTPTGMRRIKPVTA